MIEAQQEPTHLDKRAKSLLDVLAPVDVLAHFRLERRIDDSRDTETVFVQIDVLLGRPDRFRRSVDELGGPPESGGEDLVRRDDLGKDVSRKEVVRDRLSGKEVRGELRRASNRIRNASHSRDDT